MADESNNTICITPNKTVAEPIGQKQLSNNYNKFFQMLIKKLKKNQKLLKKEVQI